jgi:hypothetical protein
MIIGQPNWNARKRSNKLREYRRNAKRGKSRKIKRLKLLKHRRRYVSRDTRSRPIRGFNRPYQKFRTKFPAALDFLRNTNETLQFFNAFKQKTLLDPADEVLVDLSELKSISPDAALVLIAEATRSASFGCKLKGNRAIVPMVDQLLWDIGYYKYYGVHHGVAPRIADKVFLVHQTGSKTDGQVAKSLIEKFIPVASLKESEVKALYDALVECMANVLQHAYPKKEMNENHLPNRWWLLGTVSPKSHEISFCFYDQGVSIPKTIRTRWQHALPVVSLLSKSDNELLIEAATTGLSSTKEETRGKGLPSLTALIDEHKTGQMVIVTHKSKCIFETNAKPAAEHLDDELGGTLIIWTLRIEE